MNKTGKRINWIDWAKALGIFLVVIGHAYFPENLQYSRNIIYGFHMPFFFFLSGILHRQEPGFLKKNIERLIVPYLLFNVIVFVLFIVPRYIGGEVKLMDMAYLIKNTLFGLPYGPSGPSWFLLALFWAKMINAFLLRLHAGVAMLLSVLLAVVGYAVFHHLHKSPFFICQGLLATPLIAAGYYVKRYELTEWVFSRKYLAVLSAVVALPAYLFLAYRLQRFEFVDCNLTNAPVYGILMAILGCYLFLLFCRTLNGYENRVVQRISFGTIVVLAFHLDLYRLLLRFYSETPGILETLGACCLIVVVCYYLTGVIQKKAPVLLGGRKG